LKPLLLLILIAPFIFQLQGERTDPFQQQVERTEPDLLVVRFEWLKEKQTSRMIRGAQDPGRQTNIPTTEIHDQGARRVELRVMEKQAVKTAEKPAENYHFQLELKNAGANVVRGFVWEFQPTSMTDDYQPKQYLCALEVKPNEKKNLDVWTPYLPMKVVSANESKNTLAEGKVVINKIEYSDGSVWKISGWNFRLPADSLQKLAQGTCSVF